MPFYDLRCESCDTEHSILASIKEKSEKQITCPGCGSFELQSLFKRAPVINGLTKSVSSSKGGCSGRSCAGCGSKTCH